MVSREARIIDEYRPFLDTIGIYQDALSFLIDAIEEHYDDIKELSSQKAMTAVERMVHSTSSRKAIYPSFDIRFPKFPSYLRRAAIFDIRHQIPEVPLISPQGCHIRSYRCCDALQEESRWLGVI